MSMVNSEDRNFYNDGSMPFIERAIVAEDIEFKNFNEIVKGKFFIKVLTPTIDTSAAFVNRKVNNVSTSNCVELVIPKYMLLQFMNLKLEYVDPIKKLERHFVTKDKSFIIPIGTKFYVEFLGGDPLIEKIIIIGIDPTSLP